MASAAHYLERHQDEIEGAISDALSATLLECAADPCASMAAKLLHRSKPADGGADGRKVLQAEAEAAEARAEAAAAKREAAAARAAMTQAKEEARDARNEAVAAMQEVAAARQEADAAMKEAVTSTNRPNESSCQSLSLAARCFGLNACAHPVSTLFTGRDQGLVDGSDRCS